MGSLNDSFQSSNFLLLLFFISVSGKTYKSAIKRPIKIRTHRVVRKHTHRLTMYGRTDSWTNVQMDRRAGLSKSDTPEFNF